MNRPIGVFDSGLGGLTVLKELINQMPNEDFVYLGDTARVPYGNRSKETIINFSLQDSSFLMRHKVKAIVVACNTASSYAISSIKKNFDIPVFDVITSGSKMANENSITKKIGVMATKATVKSKTYTKKIKKINKDVEVVQMAAPLLVPLIEEGEFEVRILNLLFEKYLNIFKLSGIDTLVLGCTHYPIIAQEISTYLDSSIQLINPGVGVASDLKSFLNYHKLKTNKKIKGSVSYFVTDLNDNFVRVGEMFLEDKIVGKIKKVTLT